MSPSRKPAPQTVPVRIESGAGSEASTARVGARANGDKTAGLPVLHSEAARRAKRRDALSAPGPKGERHHGPSNGERRRTPPIRAAYAVLNLPKHHYERLYIFRTDALMRRSVDARAFGA